MRTALTMVFGVWFFCGLFHGLSLVQYAYSNGHDPLNIGGSFLFGFLFGPLG